MSWPAARSRASHPSRMPANPIRAESGASPPRRRPTACCPVLAGSGPQPRGAASWMATTPEGRRRRDDEDSGDGGSREKLCHSKDQAAVLEDSFRELNTLNPKQKAALAKQLNLKPRRVEVWFQNRRTRTKLKQADVELWTASS